MTLLKLLTWGGKPSTCKQTNKLWCGWMQWCFDASWEAQSSISTRTQIRYCAAWAGHQVSRFCSIETHTHNNYGWRMITTTHLRWKVVHLKKVLQYCNSHPYTTIDPTHLWWKWKVVSLEITQALKRPQNNCCTKQQARWRLTGHLKNSLRGNPWRLAQLKSLKQEPSCVSDLSHMLAGAAVSNSSFSVVYMGERN